MHMWYNCHMFNLNSPRSRSIMILASEPLQAPLACILWDHHHRTAEIPFAFSHFMHVE